MSRVQLALAAAIAGLTVSACSGGSSAPANTMPTASEHASHFPIATGDVHGPAAGQASANCNGCHLDTSTGLPSASFLTFSCTGCHVAVAGGTAQHSDWASLQPLHATVADFPTTLPSDAAFSAACLKCHPAGNVGPPTNHGDYFDLAATGKHPYATARIQKCSDCHTSSSRLVPADFACATCHGQDATPLATGHAAVTDYAADPAKCLACHANGVLPASSAGVTVTVASHAASAGGFTLSAGPAGHVGACLTCHPASRTATVTPPHWDYARDFKQTSCVACHVTVGGAVVHHDVTAELATIHAGATDAAGVAFSVLVVDPPAPGGLGLGAACLHCHPDGAGGAPANHEALFPRAAGTKHAGIACGSCHTGGATLPDRQNLALLGCVSCHQVSLAGKAGAYPGTHGTAGATILATTGTNCATTAFTPASADCLKCHADSQVDTVASHPGGESGFGTGRHTGAGCLTCHVVRRSDKPYPAVDFSQPNPASRSSAGCATCHNNGCGGN